jgi:hypothetical protein
LEALVDGNKIASEAQRQLYDDIKRGNYTRCHKGGHIRKDCKEPKTKWEEKFDKEKLKYWDSVVKWLARATTGSKPPLTLHQKTAPKPEQRASSIASDSDEDNSTAFPPLHYRLTMDADSDDDDNHAISNMVAGLGEVGMTTDVDMTTEESPSVSPFFQDDYIERYHTAPTAPTREGLAAIFADVNRQLAHLPPDVTTQNDGPSRDETTQNDDAHPDAPTEEDKNIAMMDAHVRAILAGADHRFSALNTALGHRVTRNTSLPPLTASSITEHIADRDLRLLLQGHKQRRRIP